MNDEQIEKLLRNTPLLRPPGGLLEKLNAGIRLPRAEAKTIRYGKNHSPFARWLPALGFAVLLLSCVVVVGMQTDSLNALQKSNEALRAETKDLDALRRANVEVQSLRAENGELDRLRQDNAELLRLRAEIAQLNQNVSELPRLRADNQQFTANAMTQSAAGANTDYFAAMNAEAERIQCVNHLKQLGLALRIWQGDNNGQSPSKLILMTNEMATWKILQCPGDKSRQVSSWADVEAGNISYLSFTSGTRETDNPNIVVFECPIHHNFCLLDGSVQMLSPEAEQKFIKTVDGRKVFER